MPNYGHLSLSCFLFRPRKSCEKRRKRSHTNVSNTLVIRTSTPPAQTSHARFHSQKWVHHSALLKESHTRAHTAKHGAFRTGVVSLPSERSARLRTSPGRVSERRTLPLWDLGREVLSKNAESLRDSDALMRVAVPKASRPRWAALSFCNLVMLLFFHSVRSTF